VATWILGVSALYHDSAVVLLRDGEVMAAAQEERFSRVKHDAALPRRAAAWCMARAGIQAGDLAHLVFYEKPLRTFERVLHNAVATFPRGWRSFPRQAHAWIGDKLWVRTTLAKAFDVRPDRILFCEHHLSHAASAFYTSPHARAAVLAVDGVGELATTTLWRGEGTALTPLAEIRFPHSLGLFYSAMTAYLGFAVNEGEYKVMGMAAWGTPRHREVLDRLLRRDPDGGFTCDLDAFCWHWHPSESFTPRLEALLGPARVPGTAFHPDDPACRRFADIAASTQAVLEDAMLGLARHAYARVESDALCLAGGVALNAVANARLAREGPHAHLWIHPAAGDAGGAMGAALWAWHAVLGNPRGPALHRVDLGREHARGEVHDLLVDLGAKVEDLGDDALARVAEDLAAGRVVGWFDGRSEWGPRALGHRSILADARGEGVAERVNARVKHREPFRPFAPAVLAEHAEAWFDLPAAAAQPARVMLATATVRPERRALLPAVTHVDGSARVQIVARDEHPHFATILRHLRDGTGVPVLLNTSFNLKGDPMVDTPVDAMAALHRSELDALHIEGFRVERPR
jgi:carbamoyltransferase